MDYDLNDEQVMLRDSARKFLSKECDGMFVRKMIQDEKGYTEDFWKKIVELGWTGLLIPEQYGGFELSFLDLTVLLYEMGYCCLPGPYFSTAVLGTLTLLESGSDLQKKAVLPEVASGERFLTMAWIEAGGGYSAEGISLKAEEASDGYVLSGTKIFVPDAHVAHTIMCVARTGDDGFDKAQGVSLFVIDAKSPGIRIEPMDTFTGQKLCEVAFEKVKVPAENMIGVLHQGWPALERLLLKVAVAKCAEMSGGAARVLEVVVEYAKQREQFGQPIGSFQAIQHHCANMLTEADASRLMTYQAAWRISEGLPHEREASMCKAWVSDSYRRLMMLGHQVMGGTGFMEEHDIHLFYNRAKAAEVAFGDGEFHREKVAAAMGM